MSDEPTNDAVVGRLLSEFLTDMREHLRRGDVTAARDRTDEAVKAFSGLLAVDRQGGPSNTPPAD